MKKQDVDVLLKALEDDFFKQMDEQMTEIEPEIEADPSVETIRKLLGEVPAQIEYLKIRTIEVRKQVQDRKILIKAKKDALEIEKSKIRQKVLEDYREELKKYINTSKELFSDVASGKKKLPNSILQEMIKAIRPEKPTQIQLDDLANLRTERLQKEILLIEKKVNKYEELYGILNVMAEKYENKNLAVRAHKGLKEAELRNLSQ